MNRKTLKYKYIIILATISIVGIFFIQFSFMRYSYRLTKNQFTESASVALKEVSWQIMVATGTIANYDSITPVEMISGNTYLVNVGVAIDNDLLKKNLLEQLKKHDIYDRFEYAIYNPDEEQMNKGILVISADETRTSTYVFPVNRNYANYFSIHFPDQSKYFRSQLSIWYFLTGLLVLVIFFFGYTLWVIICQRQLTEVQKNFINNLTHELKTPISAISLSARVLNDKKIIQNPQRLFKYARIILEQNNRMSKNVEKVLSVASLEKNRLYLNKEEIFLDELITTTCQDFKQSDNGQKATIEVNLNDLSPKINADRFHLTNVLINVFVNAVKYCETSPKITIVLTKYKDKYILKLCDNGIGIAPRDRKKIFRKFYRVPTGNIHNVKGFGLGLNYVYKIVKAHKWKIKVDENPEGGSIFIIYISE